MASAFLWSGARRELERSDSGLPITGSPVRRTAVILVRVPERAVVDGIDAHAGIVFTAELLGSLRRSPLNSEGMTLAIS